MAPEPIIDNNETERVPKKEKSLELNHLLIKFEIQQTETLL